MGEQKSKDTRARAWSFLVYPDSAPKNWREIIDGHHIKWVESPLHDRDTEEDGEVKKPHWHILMLFETLKSFNQAQEISGSVNAPIPQKAASASALIRYMVHMDNPEKYQYDKADIVAHNGAEIARALAGSTSRYKLIAEMMEYIIANGMTEFSDFATYAKNEREDDWFPTLCDNAYLMEQFIKSRRYKADVQTVFDQPIKKKPKKPAEIIQFPLPDLK